MKPKRENEKIQALVILFRRFPTEGLERIAAHRLLDFLLRDEIMREMTDKQLSKIFRVIERTLAKR